jgi:hypothetical protein
MAWFVVATNYRTFTVEAAGIGDAIDRALNLLVADRGEYLRTVEETDAPNVRVAA